jgi:hypothetical protein
MSAPGWILLIFTGLVVATVLRQIWVWARRYQAPRAFFVLVMAVALTWGIAAVGFSIGALPSGGIAIPTVLIITSPIFAHRLIGFLGGTVGTSDLLRSYHEIAALVRRFDSLTGPEIGALRRKVIRLNRFRNATTAEFIDAAQAMLLDLADKRPFEPQGQEARRQHVLALGDKLFARDDA